jgi:hypothetical protein
MSMKKILLCLLVLLSALFSFAQGNDESKWPMLKSMLLPGWGESAYNSQSAYVFWGSEATLWVAFAALRYSAHIQNHDLLSYTALHAGIQDHPGSQQYWADLGNYNSYLRHRERMLENRTPERIWSQDYAWSWDSESARQQYSSLYRKKELTLLSSEFVITGFVVNRIASMINVRYLKNKDLELSAAASPAAGGGTLHLGLRF